MNLEEAIKIIKNLKSLRWFSYAGDRGKKMLSDEEDNAIDTVLRSYNAILTNHNALEEDMDKQYNKGYQDGFKQAKFDCEMDKLPYERIIKIKDEYLKLIDFLLIDYDGCKSVETLKELIDETRDYIHKALNNDDKSAIYSAGNGKSSNILGEVIE